MSIMTLNIGLLTLVVAGAGSLSSPSHLQLGGRARLECPGPLDKVRLYSSKWFKDGEEFYRFMPSVLPHAEVFPVPGVTIDVKYFTIFLFPFNRIVDSK